MGPTLTPLPPAATHPGVLCSPAGTSRSCTCCPCLRLSCPCPGPQTRSNPGSPDKQTQHGQWGEHNSSSSSIGDLFLDANHAALNQAFTWAPVPNYHDNIVIAGAALTSRTAKYMASLTCSNKLPPLASFPQQCQLECGGCYPTHVPIWLHTSLNLNHSSNQGLILQLCIATTSGARAPSCTATSLSATPASCVLAA